MDVCVLRCYRPYRTILNTWKYWAFSQYSKQATIFTVTLLHSVNTLFILNPSNENANIDKYHVAKERSVSAVYFWITRKETMIHLIRFERDCVAYSAREYVQLNFLGFEFVLFGFAVMMIVIANNNLRIDDNNNWQEFHFKSGYENNRFHFHLNKSF